MWQVVTSFRLLRSPSVATPLHRTWIEQVQPRVAAAGLDRGWLAELIPPAGFFPYFLNPAPRGPSPALDAVQDAPLDRVRHDLDHLEYHQKRLGPRLRALHRDPRARMPRLAQEIRTYWELALAPYWARARGARHRRPPAGPPGRRARRRACPQRPARRRHLGRQRPASEPPDPTPVPHHGGAGLFLVPSAFTGARLPTRVEPPEPPQLVCPARGTGALWAPEPTTGTDALAAVLGRSRTRLLTALSTPASTTQLAHRTGLSRAGVNQCLTALRDAGLVTAHRVGRSVHYARTAAGTLLRAAAHRD